jgi:hypothetical protein
MSTEAAFAKLQQDFEQLRKEIAGKRSIPGPQGLPGNIDAAVVQATNAAERVATEAAKKAVVYPFTDELAKLRTEFESLKEYMKNLSSGRDGRDGRDGVDGATPTQETLESMVVQLLVDHHVLDASSLPYAGPYAASNIPTQPNN